MQSTSPPCANPDNCLGVEVAESILTQKNFVFLIRAVSPTSQRCTRFFTNVAPQKYIENLPAYPRFQVLNVSVIFTAKFFYVHPLPTPMHVSWLHLCMEPTAYVQATYRMS